MKITESQLRKVIKEELKKTLKESYAFHAFGNGGNGSKPHQHEGIIADILDDMRGEKVLLGQLQSILKSKGVAVELQELKDLILASGEMGRDLSYWVDVEPMDTPASASDALYPSEWGSDL